MQQKYDSTFRQNSADVWPFIANIVQYCVKTAKTVFTATFCSVCWYRGAPPFIIVYSDFYRAISKVSQSSTFGHDGYTTLLKARRHFHSLSIRILSTASNLLKLSYTLLSRDGVSWNCRHRRYGRRSGSYGERSRSV